MCESNIFLLFDSFILPFSRIKLSRSNHVSIVENDDEHEKSDDKLFAVTRLRNTKGHLF